jgi:hypothetical protein
MKALRATIYKVADEIRGKRTITLRQLYYALTVRGVLAKTEADYKRLAHITAAMRREGVMPFDWIDDSTRVSYVPSTWTSAQDALESLASQYSESPWPGAATVPEIWLEKDALAGPVYDVTHRYYVPLRVQRGYASLSALYRAAKDIYARYSRYGSLTRIYYLRDLDPSGADAARAAEATVGEMLLSIVPDDGIGRRASGRLDCLPEFTILGVTPEQVAEWKLPARPNKATDSRTAKFAHAQSVELDAIPPQQLRRLVVDAITSHLSETEIAIHEAGVESTREYLRGLAEAAP